MPSKVQGGTIPHTLETPSGEERPAYLQDAPYLLAVDTETDGFDWFDGHRPFVATASDYDQDYLYRMVPHPMFPDEHIDRTLAELREAILSADGLILHNAPFDIHMLVASGLFELEELLELEIHDTSVLARVVLSGEETGFQFGLKPLATLLLDSEAGASETAVKEAMHGLGITRRPDQKEVPNGAYRQVWDSFPDVLEKYALADTRYTYDLFHVLMERATEQDIRCYELERKVFPEVVRMEHRGIALDADMVNRLYEEYSQKAEAAFQALQEMAPESDDEFNPDSNDQIAALLMHNGVPLKAVTDTGKLRVDKWVLESHAGHPAVDTLTDYRQFAKFVSTYIGRMVGRSVIHPGLWQVGTKSGRMASSNPNMQNIPVRSGPEIRSVLVPRKGYEFIVADYASIELRVLAYYMGHAEFMEIVTAGKPFHWLGEQLFGTSDQDKWPVTRQNLKNGFYALLYGAGGPKLATTIGGGMTADEGRDFAKKIKGTLGNLYYNLNNNIKKQVVASAEQLRLPYGYVRTFTGRTLWVPTDKDYLGLNRLIQGAAADIMKLGLVNTADRLREFDGHVLLPVHDELVCEVPAGSAETLIDEVRAAMESATDLMPLAVEAVICKNNYAEAK